MLVIVDYHTGNLMSIKNALRKIGVACTITNRPEEVAVASKIILPGVGHFDFGMRQLAQLGLVDVLRYKALEQNTPVLGICLGSQLLTSGSDEGKAPGLGILDAYTCAFDRSRLSATDRIPHMGWTDVEFSATHPLAQGLSQSRFYFVHSFHLETIQPADVLVRACHGYEFAAGLAHGTVAGVQFHPEKSHRFGIQLLRNFVNQPTTLPSNVTGDTRRT